MRDLNYFELEQLHKESQIEKNREKFTTEYTCTWTKPCPHHTGWYGHIKTFWSRLFSTNGIRFYCCSLCGETLQGKELKEFDNENIKK